MNRGHGSASPIGLPTWTASHDSRPPRRAASTHRKASKIIGANASNLHMSGLCLHARGTRAANAVSNCIVSK